MVAGWRGDGISVAGSRGARVIALTVSTNCMLGIRVLATSFDTLVEGSTAVRKGASVPEFPWGGI
jgi:hypothetical protein